MPTIAEAFDAAVKLHEAGDLAGAERIYRDILKADSRHSQSLQNLGLLAQARGDLAGAHEFMSRAVEIDPTQPIYHNNQAVILQAQSRFDEAIVGYLRALALRPDYAEARSNLGSAYKDLGRVDEAMACYRQALERNPNLAPAQFNMGVVHQNRGELAEAIDCYRRAIASNAKYWQAYNNLGTVCKLAGRFSEALECYNAALGSSGDQSQPHRNRALLRLLRGEFAQGWPEYEWRWRIRGAPRPKFPQPRWNGQSLAGGTVLLTAEQGLGDVIQFVRYAPLVKQRAAGTVLLQCPASLRELLKGVAGVDRFAVEPIEQETFDCYVPLLSLPAVFGTLVDTVPRDVPYLYAQADRVAHWRQILDAPTAFKVGIAWQGNPGYGADTMRSPKLESFAPLASCPNVRLFSLQKQHGVDQLAPLAARLSIVDLEPALDRDAAFVDTAAVMMNLDLVITSDTAVAHLAGALGVRVWVALSAVPDWRWLLDRGDSPWYPTMRLFRQSQAGDWPELFARIAAELGALSSGAMSSGEARAAAETQDRP